MAQFPAGSAPALAGKEEKGAFPFHRPSQGGAQQKRAAPGVVELSAIEVSRIDLIPEWPIEETGRSERLTGGRPDQGSPPGRAARPRDGIDHGPRIAAKFRREAGRHDLEFLHTFDGLRDQGDETLAAHADILIVVVRTVDGEIVAPTP